MRKASFACLVWTVLLAACAPTAAAVAPSPTVQPTATETVALEDPPACAGAQMLYHSQLKEVLLIGCVPNTVRQSSPNVIWGWNGERWRRVTEGGPQMLLLGGSAYDEERNVLVQYGGYSWSNDACVHETWEWDGQTWAQKDVESPTACDHLEMVYDASREQIYLFGGGDENHELIGETWSWNGEFWNPIEDAGPPARAHFGFVYDPAHEQSLLYGGYADTVLEDFWVWREGDWEQIRFPGPGPLSHLGMAIDEEANELIIFGGASSTSTFSSLSDQTWRLANGSWSEVSLAEHPSPRGSPAMAYDRERQRMVLYGGFGPDRSDLHDTWEWDGSQWQCMLNCE